MAAGRHVTLSDLAAAAGRGIYLVGSGAALADAFPAGLPPIAGRSPALLPEALADLYLRRLVRRGYDLFDPHIHPTPIARHLRLVRAMIARRL